MTARTLGSLTSADLGASINTTDGHGVLTSVRHFLIDADPAAGATTCALVKVPVAKKRDPDHREIRRPSTDPVHVVPATGCPHAA
jgi:hypothetical protein